MGFYVDPTPTLRSPAIINPRGEDMYKVGGFIVHSFSRGKVELLAEGYKILSVDKFEEGRLPKRLLRVTLRKK